MNCHLTETTHSPLLGKLDSPGFEIQFEKANDATAHTLGTSCGIIEPIFYWFEKERRKRAIITSVFYFTPQEQGIEKEREVGGDQKISICIGKQANRPSGGDGQLSDKTGGKKRRGISLYTREMMKS